MRAIFTSLFLATIWGGIWAQTPIYDSITMGPGYADAVFYKLDGGTKTTANIYNSDLQIRYENRSASIRNIDGFGSKVFLPVASATSNWATLDTTGMIEQFNSDTAWENGSYNATAGGHPNYGWGLYDNVTHDIVGNKIFVHMNSTGQYKKVWIVRLNSLTKTYYIRHANLDGSNDVTDTISTSNFPSKNFGYFNLFTRTKSDYEPVGTNWDIVFRKYDRASDHYPVTGALTNLNTRTAKYFGPNPETASGSGLAYNTNMSVMGWDWKVFTPPMGPWAVEDSTAYFVFTQNNQIWRIVFTGFTGSGTGKAYFTKTKVADFNSIEDNNAALQVASVYPNPINNESVLAFTSIENARTQISLISTLGTVVYTQTIDAVQGANVFGIGQLHLSKGTYILLIEQNGLRNTQKVWVP